MLIRFTGLCVLLLLMATSSSAIEGSKLPKDLDRQVNNLSALLADAYAHPCCQDMQVLKLSDGSELILVVFTVESFGLGNNWTRYMAAFTVENNNTTGKPHYQLRDVVNVGYDMQAQVLAPDAKILYESPKTSQSRKSVTFSISEWYSSRGSISPKDTKRTIYFTYDKLLTQIKSPHGDAIPRKELCAY